MGVNQSGLAPKVAPPPRQVQAKEQTNQANQNAQSARQAALANATANANAPANTAPRAQAATVAAGTLGSAPTGGTTALGPAVRIGAPTPAQTQAGPVAMAMANAFNANFMAATGAVAVVANRKKASDVSGDSKEGEGLVELETEAEAQPDALQETNQEQGAGEITEAGSTSGPST